MSVDLLQEKIRKLKNPSVIDFTISQEMIPTAVLAEHPDFIDAYRAYAKELLEGLKGIAPAVRFSFSNFSVLGAEGVGLLQELLRTATAKGYYVLLDCVQVLSAQQAELAAQALLGNEDWAFHGLIVSSYIGTDGLKPFVKQIGEQAVFGVIRTANKSASELQDLLSGNRLAHGAAADVVNRMGEPLPGKCGYHRVGALAAASSADSLRTVRSKYSRLFMLLDGYDYPNSNAKNCSFAFDKFGHGAAACAGESVVAAWKEPETEREDYLTAAVEAAERMKKNLCRYVTIL